MPTVEFSSKSTADAVREDHADHLCPDDDRRLKMVRFRGDVPEHVLEDAERRAFQERGEQDAKVGQSDLTDREKDRIDFSRGNASVPWARSIKAIARDKGVDDWTAHVDPTLTVDEHREVMERAAREGGGRRLDAEETAEEKAGRAARSARSGECDHARGHCEHGDADACEFLQEACGFDQSEIEDLLDDDPDTSEEIEGKALGALKRSWQGYKGAIAGVEDAVEDLRENWSQAQAAARAINRVREQYGQDALHFVRLEDLQGRMLDVTRKMAADCHECHASHRTHDHDVDGGHREDVQEAVVDGAAETPVGVDEETEALVDDRRDDQATLDVEPDVREAQGQPTRPDVEEGSMLADDREDPDRGVETDVDDGEQAPLFEDEPEDQQTLAGDSAANRSRFEDR